MFGSVLLQVKNMMTENSITDNYRNNNIDIVPIMCYYEITEGDIIEFITTLEAAEKWNISDRRVRTLCREGKIEDAVLEGKIYNIPTDSKKPSDGRRKNRNEECSYYLKWDNETIGLIDAAFNVTFIATDYNEIESLPP